MARRLRLPALVVLASLVVLGLSYMAGEAYVGSLASAGHLPSRARLAARSAEAARAPTAPAQTFLQLTPDEAVALNAQTPISTAPNPAAAPFILKDVAPSDRARAQTCLAMAAYYEAGNQGEAGEAAVAQVVLNRVRYPIFPKSVCGVVFQGSEQPTGCQFTFTCDGSLSRRPSEAGWRQALAVAERALDGHVEASVGEATHYHTIWVVPYWQPTVLKIAEIGAHIFYRWDGDFGRPAAFNGQYAGAEPLTRVPPGFDMASLIPPPVRPVEAMSAAVDASATAPPVVAVQAVTPADAPKALALNSEIAVKLAPPGGAGYFAQGAGPAQHLPM